MDLGVYVDFLSTISNNIPSEVNWAITGSTALALQGIPVDLNDIDIQSTEDAIYQIEDSLKQYSHTPVAYKESEQIRSHFGRLEINDITVELMGDISKQRPDGSWEEPADLSSIATYIIYNELVVPVLPLHRKQQLSKT